MLALLLGILIQPVQAQDLPDWLAQQVQAGTITREEALLLAGQRPDLQGAKLTPLKDFLNQGVLKAQAGDYPGALKDFDQAIGINPQDAPAYVNRAGIRLLIGDAQGAFADFTQAIELIPEEAPPYIGRGAAQLNLGHPEQAIQDYSRAIVLDPSAASAYYNRANAYVRLRQAALARRDYQQAIDLFSAQNQTVRAQEAELQLQKLRLQ